MVTSGEQFNLFKFEDSDIAEIADAADIDGLASANGSRPTTPVRFSDWVVYVDESGDHSLVTVDPTYPVFVLAFCIFHKQNYSERVIPVIEKFKFNHFGHDCVVLHENEIRKQKGAFAFLSHLPKREMFIGQLSNIMDESNFVLIASVIDKSRLSRADGAGENPYHLALGICLSSLRSFLAEKRQEQLTTHVIFECRGKREDRELELEFRRVCDGNNPAKAHLPFELVLADKKTNLAGLQIADLVARPVGVHYIRPNQANKAFELLKKKFFCRGGRADVGIDYENVGLLIHPSHKAKSPDEPTEA